MLSFQDKIKPIEIPSSPSVSFADKVKPIEVDIPAKQPITQKDLSVFQGIDKFKSTVEQAKMSGIEQMKTGYKQSTESANPIVKIEGGIKGVAGAINSVLSPLAPLFEPIGKGIDYTADKISNIQTIQKIANTSTGEGIERLADDIGNLMVITGAVAGARAPTKPQTKFVGPTSSSVPIPPKYPPVVAKRIEVLNKLDSNYSTLAKASEYSSDKGVTSKQRIASTDVLVNAVDENGVIRTKQPGGAIEQYKSMTLDNADKIVRNLLEQEGLMTNLDEVKIRLDEAVNSSGLQGADKKVALNKVKQEISGLRLSADANGNIPNTLLQDAKINMTNQIDYMTPKEIKAYRKAIARGYKETIERNTKINLKVNGKDMGVRDINAELAKYLEDLDFLERLDGKKIQGGSLGKYFAQISGNVAGGVAGGLVGGFPGSALGTVIGGEVASRIKGSSMSGTFGKGKGRIAPESPILKAAIEKSKSSGK